MVLQSTTSPFAPQEMRVLVKGEFTPAFYGAIIGTTLAIVIMVVAFFIAPLFVAVPLLIVGVFAIVIAYGNIGLKTMILPVNNQFYSYLPSNTTCYISDLNVKHTTKDNVTLHGIFQENTENKNQKISERPLVIYCGGNCERPYLADSFRFAWDGQPFNSHDILWFAYRGTGPSEGSFGTHRQNVSDVIEIYKRAQKEGYTNITFIGLSFGGKVVCDAKAALLQENSELIIPLVAAHTFSTMDEVFSGNLEGSNRTALRNITSFFLKTVGHQHPPVTATHWHKTMGTDNTIIGGEEDDRIMNKHMALADVFYTRPEPNPFFDFQNKTRSDTTYIGTRVIIDRQKHGDVDWTAMN